MAKATKNRTEPTTQAADVPAGTVAVAEAPAQDKTSVQAAQFPDVTEGQVTPSSGQFDLLLDMEVPVTVILGHAAVPIRRLLQLGPGAVVQLEESIEAPVELYLQGSKFAEGDVVVVDDRLGIRIRQVTTPENTEVERKA